MKKCQIVSLIIFLITFYAILFHSDIINMAVGGRDDKTSKYNIGLYFNGGLICLWNLTHFLLFAFIGFICPNKFWFAAIIGIIWEFMEFYFEYDRNLIRSNLMCKYVNDCNVQPSVKTSAEFFKVYLGKSKKYKTLYYCSQGIYGQLIDIMFNSAGYMLGSYIFNKYYSCGCLINVYL